MSRIFQSLIQSDFGAKDNGNLEAVIVEGNSLVHWWRNNEAPGTPWRRGQVVVAADVAGPGAIIQSTLGEGEHKNFEVAVPLCAAGGRVELWHFFHDNTDINLPWQRGQRITGPDDDVAGPASVIQSGGEHGKFDVVVPLRTSNKRMELWHFFHDNSEVRNSWQRGERITGDDDDVAGPASLIQSSLGNGGCKRFETVIPLRTRQGQIELWRFSADNSGNNLAWHRIEMVCHGVSGPGILVESESKDGHGILEVLVPQGRRLSRFYLDNSHNTHQWQIGPFVTDSLTGWASLAKVRFGPDANWKFQVLAEECDTSIVPYRHPNQDAILPWLREKPVIGRNYPVRLPDTRKIVQLTGQFDRQGWDGNGTPPFAHNRTESRFGVRGTDLGSSFVHRDRTYFLFGDTWRVNQRPEEQDLDSIAFTTDTNPDLGLQLQFLERPPIIHPSVPQDGFNVPLDGVGIDDRMLVFFSTDARFIDGTPQMGRSVLASSSDGMDFEFLYEFSHDKFINVSIERVTLTAAEAKAIGVASPDVLCMWGSGRYRASDVYLAILPVANIGTRTGSRFYCGIDGEHAWSGRESDAAPLFYSGSVGELSVRWNPFLERFITTYNSDNPSGIVLHASPKPWGPWTHDPIMVFDPRYRKPGLDPSNPCLGDGYGRFMHVPWHEKKCDHAYDDMFGTSRENQWGGCYGPFQIANFARGVLNQWTQLYFVLSTWNPYQVVLMTTQLTADMIQSAEAARSSTGRISF